MCIEISYLEVLEGETKSYVNTASMSIVTECLHCDIVIGALKHILHLVHL